MATTSTSTASGLLSFGSRTLSTSIHRYRYTAGDVGFRSTPFLLFPERTSSHRIFPLHVIDEPKELETFDESANEIPDPDKLVDSINFGVLCDEFECFSSPSVEATARQLARDISQLREGNRALGCFAVSVKYKDPLRSFQGREKYKRSLWATTALEKPVAIVREMAMLSTSELSIKWTLKGRPKNPLFSSIGGDLTVDIDAKFVINQISGQVIEHYESWDLSASSLVAQAYFWSSRRAFSIKESGKDTVDEVKSKISGFSQKEENLEIYPDPSGDPTKFFQRDDGFQRDAYQVAILLAIIYFTVEFLRATL